MTTTFYKTIRFKLTLWYSTITILAALILVSALNIIVSSELNRPFESLPPAITDQLLIFEEDGFVIQRGKIRQLIEDVRRNDLVRLQRISIIAFGLISVLSIGGGYVIAGKLLDPVRKVNLAAKQATAQNLQPISHTGVEDEIGELIENFNDMIHRLRAAFDAQSEFVHNAAHELKTPLTAIRLNLDTIMLDELSGSQKDLITDATTAIDFMNKLVDDLLLLSNVDSDSFSKDKVDLSEVVKVSTEQLRPIASLKGIELRLDAKIKKLGVIGSDTLLQRAVMNIIENAIKYSPAKTQIKISLVVKDEKAKIQVSDTGDGIPANEQEKVFDRFYRIDRSRSRETGGTGLGLAITKEIVELHNGKIKLNSEDTGTTVTIILPTA